MKRAEQACLGTSSALLGGLRSCRAKLGKFLRRCAPAATAPTATDHTVSADAAVTQRSFIAFSLALPDLACRGEHRPGVDTGQELRPRHAEGRRDAQAALDWR